MTFDGELHFDYDAWNLLRERIQAADAMTTNQYIWGLDLSGTLAGAGGIGGLLASTLDGTNAFYTCDANGNITDLVDTNGVLSAHYEYDGFGSTIAQSGDQADANPFRFSSKYWDGETGFYYYGYRFYSPGLDRWIGRDPMGDTAFFVGRLSAEESSALVADSELLNIYLFVQNDSVGKWDYVGLTSIISVLQAFFSPLDGGEKLWVMGEGDSYTGIVRAWVPVIGNIVRLKQAVASDPRDWKQNHITSPGWTPTMSYSPDPKNGWNVLERSPVGTDPDTARNNFIIYILTGYATDELHTSAIGSFRIISTADEVDMSECQATLNVWMYNEMSRRSFGRFANNPLVRWRPMRSQFMWWNWKEKFKFDAQGNVIDIPSGGGGW